MTESERMIILFDGVCNLCNGFVRFIIPRDTKGHIRFASLQSEAGQHLLQKWDLPTTSLSSVVVIDEGNVYTKSTAALKIARKLNQPWPLLYACMVIPRFLRDPLYDWIARNRYRWFGVTQACLFPSPELKQRFLD